MITNIPAELKRLPQWVCFDIEGSKKMPYTPGTDHTASSNRPAEWRSFKAALRDVESGKRQHVGFCFSSSDPYVFIDLDNPEDEAQRKILKRFKSYSQKSVSGNGVHIICKGNFQGRGKHPASAQMGLFKENRFALMTGDIVRGRTEITEIAEEDLQAVHSHLGGSVDELEVDLTEHDSEIPDMTVVEMGCDRFDKFKALCCGKWQQFEEYGGDHSTADHAFIAMLADLTTSNDQVRNIFAMSGMWTSERAAKKSGHGLDGYVNRTLRKIRAKQETDRKIMQGVTLNLDEEIPPTITVREVEQPPARPSGAKSLLTELPEGLIRDVALYSYRTSFYPLQEASLCASLALFSGIAGRAFLTYSMSGLNLWPILVGGTSCGKDEYQACIGRIFSSLEKRGLQSVSKLFGGELVSGPAMEQVFQDRKRYISYMPEFGDLFKTLANPLAPEYIRNLNRAILNAYNAAGAHGTIKARRKAQGVEGSESIERPCLVLAGETTPEALYGSMTQRELATGFLQRFMLINVARESWSLIQNNDAGKAPPKELLDRIEQLVLHCDAAEVERRKGKDYSVVPCSGEVEKLMNDYWFAKRETIANSNDSVGKKEIINRAGMKAVRLATMFAVAADSYDPEITLEHTEKAISLVEQCDKELIAKFDSGEVGSGQVKQESEIRKVAEDICRRTVKDKVRLGMEKKIAKEDNVIPLSVLKSQVVQLGSFASDRVGAVSAFERCVESMIRSGIFHKVKEDLAVEYYDHTKGVLLIYRK